MSGVVHKSKIKRHVQELGREAEFKRRREELKREGVPIDEAWQRAYRDIVDMYGTELPGGEETVPVDDSGPVAKTPTNRRAADSSRDRDAKPASEREIVRWVFYNMSNRDVTEDDAPLGAWGLLEWVRDSPLNKTEFIRIWAKLLPSKAELEKADRFTDDGSDLIELNNALIACTERAVPVLPPGPEDDGGEPEVPERSNPLGVIGQEMGEETVASV